jgi:hypothetical protein
MKKVVKLSESQFKVLIENFINEADNINELTTEAPLLRKLARKSVLNFGKHNNRSVQQILDLKHPAYLRWVYYNKEGLSFLDDILKEIGIIGDDFDYQIQKPGIDPELGEKVNDMKLGNASVALKSHLKKLKKGENLANQIRSKNVDKKIFSKGSMQSRNQGK